MRFLAISLLAACASTSPLPAPLPLERALGQPEGQLPFAFCFSRDNARVSYLLRRDEEGVADLWEMDIATGKRTVLLRAEGATALSPEEQAERERRRERGKGITRYWRNPADDSFLFVIDGDLHALAGGELKRLTETPAPELSPRWSPDGKSIAFVRDKNLYVLRDGEETQLTTAGGGAVECGLAEFIAAEELGRDEGFWWSPDSTKIAYVETDVSDVPIFRMPGLDERGTPVEQRYPRPGDPNARWTLKVVGAGGGEPVPMQVEGEYLVKAGWAWWDSSWVFGEPRIYVQVADRLQSCLMLRDCDPLTGDARQLDEQRDRAWVESNDDLQLSFGGLVAVESGRKAIAFLEQLRPLRDGGPVRVSYPVRKRCQIVSPRGDVQGLVGVHAEVCFTRWTPDALGLELCMLDKATGTDRVLRAGGWRSYEPSKDCSRFVETASRAGEPPRIAVIDLDGNELCEIARGEPVPGLPKPEFLTIPAEDGTPLRAMLLRPAGKGKHPAILHCYGGPGAQMVADRWGGSTYLWHARMAQMGYAILTVDNRGSGGYGDKVLKSVHGRLLDLEVRDQTAAARWLGKQDFVDSAKIGIWGWSYGGTLSLMCLLKEPGVFAAAVAVAPVTDWRDYDTAYTERYLGLPADNPDAYARASPITYAQTLKRPLLLAHGIMDDNVHFRHATAFVEAAQEAGAPVETDFYPKGAHGIGGPAERKLLFRRMEAFWSSNLREPVK